MAWRFHAIDAFVLDGVELDETLLSGANLI